MKYLVLLFLVGVASAASIYHHDDTAVASSYMDVFGLEDIHLADEDGDDGQSEIEKKLREKFEEVLQKIKDAIDKGKEVKEELLDKAKEIREKLKELNGKISDKGKELLQKIKDKVKDWIEKFLDKISSKDKRSIKETLRELLKKLKNLILDKLDKESLKEKVEKVFGKGSELAEKLLEILKDKGEKAKQTILDFIDGILGVKEERSIAEMWDKIKTFFKDLGLDLKEKYMKFGEWVKENLKSLLDKAKDKHEKIKKIAQELKDHAKDVSKEILAEGFEFLRPYKEDLGALWDQLKDTVKEVLGKKE